MRVRPAGTVRTMRVRPFETVEAMRGCVPPGL